MTICALRRASVACWISIMGSSLFGLSGCSGDPLDAAEDVNDIPMDRKLSELKKGDAQSLCAKRFVLFGGEGGSIQCEGKERKNKLGRFDDCVKELDEAKCEYTVREYRLCGEPKAGERLCDFKSAFECVNLFSECGLKARSR